MNIMGYLSVSVIHDIGGNKTAPFRQILRIAVKLWSSSAADSLIQVITQDFALQYNFIASHLIFSMSVILYHGENIQIRQ
jgi:hypothetical protein